LRLNDLKIGPRTFIVVSTQGEQDEEGLKLALSTEAAYIAFVASRTKAEKILKGFAAQGATEESLKRVRAPAGLDIHAKSPEEIAVSILAEIIQLKAMRAPSPQPQPSAPRLGQTKLGEEPHAAVPEEATDPICGMSVNTARAKHTSDYKGARFYFCCAACKQTFDQQPEKYASLAK
jgi:xanthine dehydrogenase accessory factor